MSGKINLQIQLGIFKAAVDLLKPKTKKYFFFFFFFYLFIYLFFLGGGGYHARMPYLSACSGGDLFYQHKSTQNSSWFGLLVDKPKGQLIRNVHRPSSLMNHTLFHIHSALSMMVTLLAGIVVLFYRFLEVLQIYMVNLKHCYIYAEMGFHMFSRLRNKTKYILTSRQKLVSLMIFSLFTCLAYSVLHNKLR
jgi:hypothetical protein